MTIKRRLDALERRRPSGAKPLLVIWRHIVSPGSPVPVRRLAMASVTSGPGGPLQRLTRAPEQDEAAFAAAVVNIIKTNHGADAPGIEEAVKWQN